MSNPSTTDTRFIHRAVSRERASRFHRQISGLRYIRQMPLPRVQPIIPVTAKEPFDDPDWLFEFKYDGYRLCYIEAGRGRFISRNGNTLSRFRAHC